MLKNILGRVGHKKNIAGWFAASMDAEAFAFAHGEYVPSANSAIDVYGAQALASGAQALQRIASDLKLDRYQCSTLLRPGEYQLLLVEAPNVPKPELKSAMRWRIKDMIDYHVDDATLDVLDIPPDSPGSSRTRLMYVVCARNDVIQGRVKLFQDARIPLSVIDIPECAQRNLAALFEDPDRGLALVYFGNDWGLLTVNYRGELYLARRLELGLKQLGAPEEEARKEALDRIVLELQRTFDHFDRQFPHVPISRLLVAPTPEETGLADFLGKNLALPVAPLDLRGKLNFDGAGPDPAMQWRLFHHFGAALRYEGKAL